MPMFKESFSSNNCMPCICRHRVASLIAPIRFLGNYRQFSSKFEIVCWFVNSFFNCNLKMNTTELHCEICYVSGSVVE